MKSCELCKSTARIYCESDQASLCWTCDAKVHSANFLVARHLRCLLCNSCQSPTPWSASGDKIGRTISICQRCVKRSEKRESEGEREESQGGNEEFESGSEYDGDEDSGDEEDDMLEKNCENQVVPWSSTLSSPPPAVSSSDSEVVRDDDVDISLKRSENILDLYPKEKLDNSCFHPTCSSEMAAGSCIAREKGAYLEPPCLRPFKFRKLETGGMSRTHKAGSAIREEVVDRVHPRKVCGGVLDLDLNQCP